MTAPAADTPTKYRERLTTDFDVNDLGQRRGLSKADIAAAINIPVATIYQWAARKLWPLAAYKAVIARFAPDDAERYEMRQVVGEQKMPFTVSQETMDLAARYDVLRAGAQMAYANGQGFYRIDPPKEATALALLTDDDERAEQDLLLQIIARITADRNSQALELARLRQTIADKDAQLTAAHDRIKQLQSSVKEWEQLADRTTSPIPVAPDAEARVADRVVELLKRRGLHSLTGELQRINPQTGHRH